MAATLVLKGVLATKSVGAEPFAPPQQQIAKKHKDEKKKEEHFRRHRHESSSDDEEGKEKHRHKKGSRRHRRRHKREEEEEEKGGFPRSKHAGDAIEGVIPSAETIATYLDDYLDRKIRKYMLSMSREEAVRSALRKAHCKKWPVVESDSGYGHGVVLAALGGESGGFDLSIEGTTVHSGPVRRQSDDEIRSAFVFPAGLSLPCRGKYSLRGKYESTPVGASGYYDLVSRGVVPGAGAHLIPMPLYRQRKTSSIASFGLPHCLIHATVEPIDGTSVRVLSLELVVRLRPCAAAMLDPRSAIPCSSARTVLEPSRHLFGFASEEDRASSECASRPAGLDEVIKRIFEGRIGTDLSYRFSSHVGSTPMSQVGRSSESHREFYRLGHCTQTLAIVALLKHIQSCAPMELGHVVDLHDPKLTKFLLKRSGAQCVYKGLKRCYSCFGRGTVPAVYDLMNHTSGLPDHVDVDTELLTDILGGGGSGSKECDALLFEKSLGDRLGRCVRPLHAPGGEFHHSHLAFAVLRHMLPDWKESLHSSSYIVKCAAELGMPTLCFTGTSQEAASSHAASCPTTCNTCVTTGHGEAESPLYAISVGASCRVDEWAAFLAASGPSVSHSWSRCPGKPHEGIGSYAFLPDTLAQRTCIDRRNMIYHGYGYDHVGLPCKGFGKHGLRAVLRYGATPTHHVFVSCIVPALSLSFAFGTNADFSVLCERGAKSLVPLLTELVSAHAVKLSSIENASLKQATIFNPILNQQLCAAPDPGACFAQHVKYCASKTPYCTARDGRLDPFTGEVFLSITDIKHSLACIKGSGGALSTNPEHYASPVTLLIEYKEVSIDAKGDQKRGVYYLTERYAHGDSHTRPIVYDPDAYATAEGARSSFEAHAKGFALDKKGCGTFRTLQPSHELLGEHLDLSVTQIDARDPSTGKSQSVQAKIVCFRGRMYVRGGLYELVRKSILPTLGDRVTTSLAARKPEIVAAQVEEPSVATTGGLLSDLMLSAANIGAQIPNSSFIGPRGGGGGGGGGFRGGYGGGYGRGGWGYGGYGLGFGTGALLGAAAFSPYYGGYYGAGYGGYGGMCPPGLCRVGWRCVPCGGYY